MPHGVYNSVSQLFYLFLSYNLYFQTYFISVLAT